MINITADWLSSARKEILKLNTGQQFVLSDLFTGIAWKQMSGPDQSFLGNLFLWEVNAGKIEAYHNHIPSQKGSTSERMQLLLTSRIYYLKNYSGYKGLKLQYLKKSAEIIVESTKITK
jgi:hypothetical protein